MRLKTNLTADATLLAANIIWGTTFVVVEDVLKYLSPISYLMFRMLLAALILLILFTNKIKQARWSELKASLLLGTVLGAGYAGQAIGQIYTTPTKSAFITGLATPLVPLVSLILLRLKPSLGNLIGVILASVGGALMFTPQGDAGVNIGDLITLGCAILFALHITLACHYAKQYDTQRLTVFQIAATAIVLTIFWLGIQFCMSLLSIDSKTTLAAVEARPLQWSARAAWEITYLAIVGTVVTYLLWTWGQARRSPTHVAIMFSLHPVFAYLIAIGLYGMRDWLGTRASIGAALILISVIITQLRRSDKSNTSHDSH